MKKVLLFLCTLLLAISGWAQIPQYFVGNNTGSNAIPFGGNIWADNRSQLLYLPGEFGAAPPGLITTIYFRAATTVANATYTNFQIDMGQSAITTLTTTWETGLTTVLSSPSHVMSSTTGQWFAIALTAPISYNPAQSLIVDIRQTATSPAAAIGLRNFTPPAPATSRRTWTGPNPSTSPTAGGIDALVEYDFGFDILTSCDSVINFKFNNLTRTSVDISWDPQPGATGYEYVVDQTITDPPSIGYATVPSPSLSLSNLPDGTCYYVHIRTNCPLGMTSNWSLDSFCTIADCKVPEVIFEDVKGTSAIARWAAVPGALGYEYSTGTTPNPPTKGAYTTYTNVKLQGLIPNAPLYFYIRAQCSPTPLSEWGVTPFHTTVGTGIDEISGNSSNILVAYPNPITDIMKLKINAETDATLTITDITGKVLQSYDNLTEEMNINMANLPTGIYIVKYSSNTLTDIIRVTKQ